MSFLFFLFLNVFDSLGMYILEAALIQSERHCSALMEFAPSFPPQEVLALAAAPRAKASSGGVGRRRGVARAIRK